MTVEDTQNNQVRLAPHIFGSHFVMSVEGVLSSVNGTYESAGNAVRAFLNANVTLNPRDCDRILAAYLLTKPMQQEFHQFDLVPLIYSNNQLQGNNYGHAALFYSRYRDLVNRSELKNQFLSRFRIDQIPPEENLDEDQIPPEENLNEDQIPPVPNLNSLPPPLSDELLPPIPFDGEDFFDIEVGPECGVVLKCRTRNLTPEKSGQLIRLVSHLESTYREFVNRSTIEELQRKTTVRVAFITGVVFIVVTFFASYFPTK